MFCNYLNVCLSNKNEPRMKCSVRVQHRTTCSTAYPTLSLPDSRLLHRMVAMRLIAGHRGSCQVYRRASQQPKSQSFNRVDIYQHQHYYQHKISHSPSPHQNQIHPFLSVNIHATTKIKSVRIPNPTYHTHHTTPSYPVGQHSKFKIAVLVVLVFLYLPYERRRCAGLWALDPGVSAPQDSDHNGLL